MSVFLHGHHGQCGSNHIVANRGILFQPPCLLVLSRLVDNRTLNGAVVRKPVCVTCRDLRTCPSSAGRFTTQARLLACLQVVPVCSQLSRNEAFSHFKKRSFYIIPQNKHARLRSRLHTFCRREANYGSTGGWRMHGRWENAWPKDVCEDGSMNLRAEGGMRFRGTPGKAAWHSVRMSRHGRGAGRARAERIPTVEAHRRMPP